VSCWQGGLAVAWTTPLPLTVLSSVRIEAMFLVMYPANTRPQDRPCKELQKPEESCSKRIVEQSESKRLASLGFKHQRSNVATGMNPIAPLSIVQQAASALLRPGCHVGWAFLPVETRSDKNVQPTIQDLKTH
jgi:hypothetical protein